VSNQRTSTSAAPVNAHEHAAGARQLFQPARDRGQGGGVANQQLPVETRVEAVADEADKRSTRLSLSEEGKPMFAALHVHDGALAEAALAGIPDAERATLLDLLARVRANLEAGQG